MMNRAFTIIFLAFAGLSVFALEPSRSIDKYFHKSWGKKDGMPQSSVFAIAGGGRGYLWLATSRGLMRFDGTSFKEFAAVESGSVKTRKINCLISSASGTLWYGTHGGGAGRFRNFKSRYYTSADGLPGDFVTAVTLDKAGNTWLGTLGNGIVCIDRKDDRLKIPGTGGELAGNPVTALLADSRGLLWIGTRKGLGCYGGGKLAFFTEKNGLPDNHVTALARDAAGNIWVGTAVGLCKAGVVYSGTTGRLSCVFSNPEIVTGFPIHALLCDSYGSVWISGERGFYRVTRDINGGDVIKQLKSEREFFKNRIIALYEDNDGTLWLGTETGGFGCLKNSPVRIFDEEDGLSGREITAVYRDYPADVGVIWLGTRNAGLNRYKDGRFTAYTLKDGLQSNCINAIAGDHKGNLWVGTDKGLSRLEKGVFKTCKLVGKASGYPVKALMVDDSSSILLVGTYGGGLNIYKNGIYNAYDSRQGLSDDFVLCIEDLDYNGYWVGTLSGLNIFKDNAFGYFTNKVELPAETIRHISHEWGHQVAWIVTGSGKVLRFRHDTFYPFTLPGELAGSNIYRVFDDYRSSLLWLTSDAGLFCLSNPEKRDGFNLPRSAPVFYHIKEGLLPRGVFTGNGQPAGFKTRENALWLPTTHGAAFFIADRALFTESSRPVYIDRVLVDDRPFGFDRLDEIPGGPQKITICFSTPDFYSPGEVRYKYWLQSTARTARAGNWRPVETGNRVILEDLPGGMYWFRITAGKRTGGWNYRKFARLNFRVKTRFYESIWFLVVLVLVLFAAAVAAYKYMGKPRASKEQVSLLMKDGKYKGSALERKGAKRILNKLLKVMEEEKPYLDSSMNLAKLAEQLEVSKEDLSQVINMEMYSNFNASLNRYRVEEAKRKLRDPKENRYVILKIAYDVGFNSKSSFNSVFKEMAGMSPSHYRKKAQQPGSGVS